MAVGDRRYRILLTDAAKAALAKLDQQQQRLVVKQLRKLERAPELGKPCGNKAGIDLTGCRKVYLDKKALRIIYAVDDSAGRVEVINIGARVELRAYREAAALLRSKKS